MAGSISASVGNRGANADKDVRLIKSLLNAAWDRYPKFAASGITKFEEINGTADDALTNAIKKFQETVMGWSASSADGKVDPGRMTWKALNGNVGTPHQIKPQVTPGSMWKSKKDIGGFVAFRQGDSVEKLGNSTSGTIARYGCALCTLTMAATSIGFPNEHWPTDLLPKDLTPSIANEILRKAGAFSQNSYSMVLSLGAAALGMGYDEYGRYANLGDEDLTKLDDHLRQGNPIAAHVDYRGGEEGDHWILVYGLNMDNTYSAIDPATGTKIFLTSARNQTVDNARYATTKDQKTGVLFGWRGSGGNAHQQSYVVVRFGLLS